MRLRCDHTGSYMLHRRTCQPDVSTGTVKPNILTCMDQVAHKSSLSPMVSVGFAATSTKACGRAADAGRRPRAGHAAIRLCLMASTATTGNLPQRAICENLTLVTPRINWKPFICVQAADLTTSGFSFSSTHWPPWDNLELSKACLPTKGNPHPPSSGANTRDRETSLAAHTEKVSRHQRTRVAER